MDEAADLTEEAAGGFLPGGGGGYDLAATLAVIPGMLTAFGTSLAALSGWMAESKICRPDGDAPGAVAAIAQRARAAVGIAQDASDRYRKENEFWLQDGPPGQASPVVTGLADGAGTGFVPHDDAVNPPGYILAGNLEAFPDLFELIAEQLSILAGELVGESSALVTETSHAVNAMAEAAETAHSTFQHENSFWLSARKK